MSINWKNEEIISQIDNLASAGMSSTEIASILSKRLDEEVNSRSVRRVASENGITLEQSNRNGYNNNNKEEEIRHADGSLEHTKPIEMSPEEAKDENYILKAHGFNPDNWIITSLKNSSWDQGGSNGVRKLYSSKITVKPKVKDFDVEEFIEHLVDHKEPYQIDFFKKPQESHDYLAIPAFDTHFDGKTLGSYQESLKKQLNIIAQHDWKDILIILGGDIAHVDNINSTTTRGTQLETTDLMASVDEMEQYFEPIVTQASKYSRHVQVIYAKGNHDIGIGYMFARILEKSFSKTDNVDFDISLEQYKAYTLGNNFIGATHGNKGQKNYVANFASRFSVQWGQSTNRELYTGHLHNELSKDLGGFIQRQVSTRKPTDAWTDDLGVVSTKSFEVVAYNENETEAIYYV